MLKYSITEYKEIRMIGKVFRENGINYIFGESGVGKTISTINAINEDDIIPILLDFDDNMSPAFNKCKYVHIDGKEMMKNIKDTVVPEGEVIVVDTWVSFENSGGTIGLLQDFRANNNTVIIVDHNQALATKQDLPNLDSEIVNHLDSKLFLKRKSAGTELHILKSRGYAGEAIIPDWMRRDRGSHIKMTI